MYDNSLFYLETEIRNVLNSYFDAYDDGEKYNFRCNVCGDSKRDKYKKRGYILKSEIPWRYYCHNCHVSMPVYKWLKEFFPNNYKTYMKQKMMMGNIRSCDSYDNIKTSAKEKIDPEVEKKYTKYFKPILGYPHAVEFCEKRKIPKDVYSKWYYAENVKENDNKYRDRIIITFYNDKNKIYYYQGRTLKGSMLKYLSRKGDYNSVYNFYLVDRSLPVIILEGPIDSVFVENSVAVTGLKIGDKNLNNFAYKYYLLDNDESGKKKSVKLLKERSYVFNWKLFLKDYPCEVPIKDVNDFIIHNKYGIEKLTWELIEKYFTKSIYDKLYFV